MRTAVAATCLLLLTACGSPGGDTATDPGPDPASGSPTPATSMPTAIPAVDGPVAGFGTVLDTDGPQLCLGPVAESYPPQCSGLPLAGWAWDDHAGTFDHAGRVRFATYLVTGRFDGTTLTYDSDVPGALYDPARTTPPTSAASEQHTQAQLDQVATALRGLPGFLTSTTGDNLVVVEVVHDDGTLQAWADEEYGAGLVAVRSALTALGQQ